MRGICQAAEIMLTLGACEGKAIVVLDPGLWKLYTLPKVMGQCKDGGKRNDSTNEDLQRSIVAQHNCHAQLVNTINQHCPKKWDSAKMLASVITPQMKTYSAAPLLNTIDQHSCAGKAQGLATKRRVCPKAQGVPQSTGGAIKHRMCYQAQELCLMHDQFIATSLSSML